MTNITETKELQNQSQIDDFRRLGPATMGPWTSHIWRNDPRHLGFLLARYKFVSKMLTGRDRVLEVGCGDAVGTPVVLQTVGSVHGIDFEPLVVNDAIERYRREGVDRATFAVHDMLGGGIKGTFDAAFSLDVIEHIPQQQETLFIDNIVTSLTDQAVFIMGTPNITANEYASPASKAGHINLKSADTLKHLLSSSFHNVFIFSMNDEHVHTGYSQMAHYLFGMGVGVKRVMQVN
jgi:2-polyprenyl-3-methyl-5-hydroxy-6-metoxy-1,4-benzoquinol methylase